MARKIALTIFSCLLFLCLAAFGVKPDSFIPKGWQAGNGFKNDLVPYYAETNIDRDAGKEIILHYSFMRKGEHWPNKHIISFLNWNGKKYEEKWRKNFDSFENIFFLVSDLNNDGEKELIVHGLHSGNAANGNLWIFRSGKTRPANVFDKPVQGEMYLWDVNKRRAGICPDYFPDLDKDGIKEIIVGRRAEADRFDHVSQPWWHDVYKWDGKKYILADDQFPEFYKKELSRYKSFIKEKGEDGLLREYVARAAAFAGLADQ